MEKQIIAVVVTYNRKELLMECLTAILAQTYSVQTIVLVDNASTDGTKETLAARGFLGNDAIEYHAMQSNLGGAGGFYEGLKIAREKPCDWVWVMDDDAIPTDTCLEQLLAADDFIAAQPKNDNIASAYHPSFYASAVYGANGEFMNLPVINQKQSPNGYAYWYAFLKDGLVSVSTATFVSVLIKKDAIIRCGLPVKDYFIWGDDTEYTRRLTTFYGDAYFVGDSVAVHKRVGAKSLDIYTEPDVKRQALYFYFYRNNKINAMYYNNANLKKEYLRYLKFLAIGMLKCRTKRDCTVHAIQCKGSWAALRQFKTIKTYIDGQLNGL